MKKEKRLLILLMLCIAILLGMSGCGGNSDDIVTTETNTQSGSDTTEATTSQGGDMGDGEYIDGGNTKSNDPNAPKEIESKDIADFHVNFYLHNRYSEEEKYGDNHFFDFSVKKDESGVLTAYEDERGISYPADEYLLEELQDVIDEHKLVLKNGDYDVTAGLPPECGPVRFEVDYESGEKLQFTEDDLNSADWEEAIYDVFAEWFSDNGIDDLYPQNGTYKVSRIHFQYIEDGIDIEIDDIKVREEEAIDGEQNLIFLADNNENDGISLAKKPDDYFDRLTEIVNGSGLYRDYKFHVFDDKDEDASSDAYLRIYIEYDTGDRIVAETRDKNTIQQERYVVNQLLQYFGYIFNRQFVEEEYDMTPVAIAGLRVGDSYFGIDRDYNQTADDFINNMSAGELEVEMHDDGKNAKLGELPWTLSTDDKELTAVPGEIVVIEGNKIAVCYEERTGSFTKLGKLTNFTEEDKKKIKDVFGGEDDIKVQFIVEWTE
jgi:hypothetical protein